ncbi:MAG: Stp1/IreP family PP2C-type Ser/Thr phosphatase [Erysipelotrichaceae bacterium]
MKYFGITDKGLIRKTNQDRYVVVTNLNKDTLVIVCDGIGGANAGDVASEMAIRYFSDVFSGNHGFENSNQAKQYLDLHIQSCNEEIYRISLSNPSYKGMGTTLVGVLITKSFKLAFNIGDSRVYKMMNQSLIQVTKDHNYKNELMASGHVSEDVALAHPQHNYLTRAMGITLGIKADFFLIYQHPEYLLVSSDGLHGYVEESWIEKIINDENLLLNHKVNKLIEASYKNGGLDNITLVLVQLKEDDYAE